MSLFFCRKFLFFRHFSTLFYAEIWEILIFGSPNVFHKLYKVFLSERIQFTTTAMDTTIERVKMSYIVAVEKMENFWKKWASKLKSWETEFLYNENYRFWYKSVPPRRNFMKKWCLSWKLKALQLFGNRSRKFSEKLKNFQIFDKFSFFSAVYP